MTLPDRFWVKVDKTEGCWLWTAALTADGYGNFKISGAARTAHRLAYESLIGEIPEGLQLDHLCRNRACVNPAHLEPVSPRENVLRGEGYSANRARQTHCKRGHLFDAENTYVWKPGSRACRACHRQAVAKERRSAA